MDGIQGKFFAIFNNQVLSFIVWLFLILNPGDRIVMEYEKGNKINPIIVDKTKPRDWFRGALFSQMVLWARLELARPVVTTPSR